MVNEKEYQISGFWHNNIFEITIAGKATKQDAANISDEIIKLQTENKATTVLINTINLKGRLNTTDTYLNVKAAVNKHIYGWPKIAVLDIIENQHYYSFHETVAINSGLNLRYFTSIEKALSWLENSQCPLNNVKSDKSAE